MGKKSGKVGLNPNHSSLCSGNPSRISRAFKTSLLIRNLANGFSKQPNPPVPTTLQPFSLGFLPTPYPA